MALTHVLANFETSLANKISSTSVTLTLATSTDDDGTALSGDYILTIDEGTNSEEHVKVTLAGASGSGVVRGLSKVDMTTSKNDNKFAHDRGAVVKLTNAMLPKIVNRLNGDEAFDSVDLTGVQSISGLATPTVGETTKAANIDYVNSVAIAGGADASTTVKGINKMSVAPASATNPIAVGDNDPRVPTTDENDALVGTSGTPSTTNKYVTNDDTAVTATADKIVRADSDGKIDNAWISDDLIGLGYFGDGSDGEVTISGATTLTADMYYENLTIETGQELKPNGYKIFVRDTLTLEGTGKIAVYGGDGVDGTAGAASDGGAGGIGGTKGTQANTAGTLPASAISGDGGNGEQNGGQDPEDGDAGEASTKAVISSNGSAGGDGGDGASSGMTGGVGGVNTGTPINPLATYNDVYDFLDLNDNTIARMDINTGAGGGAGGGTGPASSYYSAGAGGGGGAGGGIAWISAKNIVTIDGNDYIDVHGGTGGDGGDGAGSSGGGAGGGNGGICILIYYSKTGTGTINIALGTGGLGGTGGTGGDGGDGGDGVVGESYLIQIK